MMDIFNTLGGMGQAQQNVGAQLGLSADQTGAAMEAALPLLLGALTHNASQPGGLDALSGALDQHDGSALDAFSAGQTPDMADGQNILGHVFGGQQTQAAQAVGRRAGIDPQLAMQLLAMLAPLVMGYLGRQRQGQGGAGGGLASVLGGLLGGAGGSLGSILGGLLGGGQAQQPAPTQSAPTQGVPMPGGSVLPGYPSATGQSGTGQSDPGGLSGTLGRALGHGGGGALDDLISMFGGKRR